MVTMTPNTKSQTQPEKPKSNQKNPKPKIQKPTEKPKKLPATYTASDTPPRCKLPHKQHRYKKRDDDIRDICRQCGTWRVLYPYGQGYRYYTEAPTQ